MFSRIRIIYNAVDCCTLILAELGTILFYLKKKKKKKNLDFFYRLLKTHDQDEPTRFLSKNMSRTTKSASF